MDVSSKQMKPIGIEDAPALLVSKTLSASGLRPTRQRLALAALLFNGSHRHVTAERLFDEAIAARLSVSLATVYNTLHQFTTAGLLREIAVDGAKVYFDTNVSEHHHFLNEETGELLDIEDGLMQVGKLPPSPKGLRVARVDIVIRLRPDQP